MNDYAPTILASATLIGVIASTIRSFMKADVPNAAIP